MLKGTAHHSFVKIFSKVAKKKTQQFVSALLIYSQLLQVAAFAATPMQVNHMSSSSPWRNSTQSITPELSSPVTPLESLYLNNQQFGLNGPLTWGVNYSDLTGTFLNAQYLFPVNERLVFAALGEYGSGQYRYGGTVGYEFLPLSQVKFTAERFNQRLPFQFDSGAIEERVHQDAYGARFQQLFVHPFLQTVNAGGYYADASDKNLNPFVFASNGLNCSSQVGIECINYRHIAGATSKGIDAGVEVLLTPATLVGGNIYYDQVHYHTLFSDIFHENREGIGAAVKINHLFNSQFKFLGEASVRKIYDSYQGGIGWLPPLKDKRLEFALTGQHLVSHNSTPNNNSISLQVNWTPGSKEYEKRFNWRGKQLASVAQWVQMPAVHMNQVLAIAEQVTRYLAPAITAVTPNSGLFAGGNTITISGFNFIQGAQVFFGNQIAPLTTVQSSSLINVTVPPIASVASSLGVDIRVQNPDGQQATLPSGYTYGTPLLPKIAKVSLSKGNIYGDSTVVITGKNFTELTRVSFGGAAAKIVAQNKTELTVITPSHEAGVVDVVVATEKGSTTAKGVFTYVADAFQLPIIKKITANSGATTGGETVTISGSNFDENTSITFGGVAASIVSQNDAEVVVTVPSHDAGVVDVVVTTGKGSATAKESYTFVANSNSFNAKAPTIEKIIANSGATTGGETVTISGSNFDATTSVTFDSATAKIVSQNDKQVVITTPAHDAGVVDVIVTTENGSTKATNSYTYKIKKQANFAPPLIVNIFPTSGPTSGGQSVTIVGSNFVVGGSTVIFGASPATITSESSTVLVVTTPAGVGTVSVVVNTAEGSSNPASYSYDGPTIVGVSPSSGPTTGGQTVTITGNNFFPGAQSVTFGGIAAPIVSSTFNQIEVTTPPNSPGLTNIVVTTASGSSNNGSYTYVASPTLATVSPDSGPTAGGQTVTITGSNFVVGGTSVSFAGSPGTSVNVSSSTQLTVVTPAGTAGLANVVVTTVGGSSGNGSYTYVASPTLATVSPDSGPTSGGQTVTITGSNFVVGGTSVSFAGSPGTSVNVNSSTQLTVVTPAGAAGLANVVVTTVGGSSGNGSYTYVAPPTLTTVSPDSGPTAGGQTVTITGSNFVVGGTSVSFAGSPGTSVNVNSSTQLTVVTPAGTAGLANVVVTTVGGSSGNGSYTYVASPTLATVSPNLGPASGGQTVTITGSNFVVGGTSVSFAGSLGTSVNVSSSTQLTVVTPAGTAGLANVVVTTVGGSSGNGSYTYVASPTLATVSPNLGPASGGQTVTITGSNFVVGGTSVSFAGSLGTSVNVSSSTQLTVVTPAGTAGLANVVVTTVGGSSGNGSYTYVAPPTLTTVSPNLGPASGGQTVTITGSNFVVGGTSVSFAGSPGTSVNVSSSTQLTVVTPAGTPGFANVVVTTIGGSVSNTNAYTYLSAEIPSKKQTQMQTTATYLGGGAAVVSGTLLLVNTNSVAGLTSPVVSQSSVSVSSLSGSVRGGNTVKLKGNFGVPTRVSFGGKAAKIIGKPSTGIVTVVTPAHSHGPVDIKITTNKGIVIAQKAFIYNQYG